MTSTSIFRLAILSQMENCIRWRASQISTLNDCMEGFDVKDDYISWVITFQNPFKTFARRPICQCLAIGAAIYFIFCAATNGFSYYSYGVSQSQYLEMTISTTHAAGIQEPRVSDSLSHFHFIRAGCNITRIPNISEIDSSVNNTKAFKISFPSTVETDGMVFVLRESFQCEGIRFQASGTTDLGWRTISGSTFRKRRSGIHFSSEYVPCQHTLTFDYRAPWTIALVNVMEPTFQALLCVAFSLSGLLRATGVGTMCILLILLVLATISAAVGIGYLCLGEAGEGILPFAFTASYLALAASFRLAPFLLIDTIAATACVVLLVRVVVDCAVFGDPSNLSADFPALNLLLAVASTAALAARRRFIARAMRDARADRALYDRAWLDFSASQDTIQLERDLARLAAVAQRARDSCGAERPRQLNRPADCDAAAGGGEGVQERSAEHGLLRSASGGVQQLGFFRRASSGGISAVGSDVGGRDDPALAGSLLLARPGCCPQAGPGAACHGGARPVRPVGCLDQLYAQAFTASVLLRDRCSLWATVTGGRVGTDLPEVAGSDSGSVAVPPSAEEAELERGRAREMEAVAFKNPQRAADKARTCYGGDVSQLLDICRERVWFRSLRSLTQCLEVILSDPGVRILRIKDLISPLDRDGGFGGGGSAGFRVCAPPPRRHTPRSHRRG